MGTLLQLIGEWIKEGLIEAIVDRFSDLFAQVNEQVGDVAAQVGQTPQGWNTEAFDMVRNLSETVIIPIAGLVLTFVMTYELIQMVIDKNNLHNFETFFIYKWVFKTFVAVLILTNCFNLVMAVFDVAQDVINESAGLIGDNLDLEATLEDLEAQLNDMSMWSLLGLWLETIIISLAMKLLSVVIFVIVWGRMIEIYLVVSLAPIPLATMANHEWGTMGTNYFKSLFALAFQGFLIMVCMAIYAVLIQTLVAGETIFTIMWGTVAITVLLAYMLKKTASISLRIFGAH